MNYVKLDTMEYSLHEGDIRIEHPEIPEALTGDDFPVPNGYARINVAVRPEVPNTQYVVEGPLHEVDGEWYIDWIINDYTPEQLAEITELNRARIGRSNIDANGAAPNVIE